MRSRKKPGAYAGTGERPISIQGEAKLDKAIAEATAKQEQRIRILEQENARLQIQLENKKIEAEEAQEEDKPKKNARNNRSTKNE